MPCRAVRRRVGRGVVLPKRWLVERTFAWLMHSRRLARDYETRTDTSEAVIKWAMSTVMSRRLARRAR
ncbi:transposase [Streptomyces sp. NPDC017943]|uniref:transposase n=1 Tax=Streptomyces sp. NPDC017943 TaxID=3365019 RepID=UPI0037891AA4